MLIPKYHKTGFTKNKIIVCDILAIEPHDEVIDFTVSSISCELFRWNFDSKHDMAGQLYLIFTELKENDLYEKLTPSTTVSMSMKIKREFCDGIKQLVEDYIGEKIW